MRKLVALGLVVSILLIACNDRDDDLEYVNLRIKNNSSFVFDTVLVGTAMDPHLNVDPGSYSVYFEYEVAYRYAYIEINSGEETFILQPIDFVGETPLPFGFYTYELDLTESGEVLLDFVVD